MGKQDKELRKKKARERKVARKKIREREERRQAEKKAELEELRQALILESGEPEMDQAALEDEDGNGEEEESPFELERFQRYLWKAAVKAGYDPDDLTGTQEEELLDDWPARRRRLLAEDPAEEAQELMYQAMEEGEAADWDDWKTTPKVQQALIRDALALDPENIDALTLQGELAFDLVEEEDVTGFRLLNEAVRRSREALGPGFFQQHQGRLHVRVEAKPFLRALTSLAEHYDGEQRLEEAFPVLRELIGYQPEGAGYFRRRYLDAALCLGRADEARRLLAQPDIAEPVVRPWAECLLEFGLGNREKAATLLDAALAAAPYFPHTLADWDEEPEGSEGYSDLDRKRGQAVALALGRAWRKVPGARDWLREELLRRGPPAGPKDP